MIFTRANLPGGAGPIVPGMAEPTNKQVLTTENTEDTEDHGGSGRGKGRITASDRSPLYRTAAAL